MADQGGEGGAHSRPSWEVIVVIAVAILACCILGVLGGGAAWVLWARLDRDASPGASATQRAVRIATATSTATPTTFPAPTETATPTRLPPSTPTRAAPTLAATATPAPRATPTRTPRATPTPVVCDSVADLVGITLAPGQAFRCAFGQDELDAQLAAQPNLPCRSASLDLVDGAVQFTCQVGFPLRASVALDAADCRASIRVVGGTPGFTQVVQQMIDQYMATAPHDQYCIERAAVTRDAVIVEGYRR
ncbi:MAG: hypothetical protein JXA09_15030 [Anaerolineae bacterium]|nr:hypothetical protein [Anaerolineae bacterium]